MKKPVLIVALLLMPAVAAGQWDVYTNVRSIHRLLADSSHVYAATSGGLYVRDLATGGAPIYNSGDGLGGHDLKAIARDGSCFWLGGTAGILTCFNPRTGAAQRYPLELGVTTIEALAVSGDTVWVGTDIGLGLFLPNEFGGLLKEVYSHLGAFPAETGVRDIMLTDSMIWLATESGIATAPRAASDLYLPSRWTTYGDSSAGLPSARTVAVWHDSVWTGTDSGLYVLATGAFEARFRDHAVRTLYAEGDTMWVGTSRGLYLADADSVYHLQTQNIQTAPVEAVVRRPGGHLWVGFRNSDLFYHIANTVWFYQAKVPQPSGSLFSDVSVASGLVWCALYADGVNYLDPDGVWHTVREVALSAGAPMKAAASGAYKAYFPGWGQGLFTVQPTGDSLSVDHFTAQNSALAAVPTTTDYTVTTDAVEDPQGGYWVANSVTGSEQCLVYFAPGDTPQLAYGTIDDVVPAGDVNVLLLSGHRLWIGFDGIGLGVLDFNYTPLDKSDDRFYLFNKNLDRLPADVITALVEDQDGAVWVGTSGGLARLDQELFPYIGSMEYADLQPADGSVLSLAVDPANNVWVGTTRGLVRLRAGTLSADSAWFAGATPLPDNRVNGLAVDVSGGALWVATGNGLGRYPLHITRQTDAPDVYPNPLRLRYDGDYATFDVPAGSRIDIYALSGDRVRTITTENRWDGRNDAGTLVGSGLYLFRVTFRDGTTGRGRLGVIRER